MNKHIHDAVTFNAYCDDDEEDFNATVTFDDNCDEDEEYAPIRLTLSGLRSRQSPRGKSPQTSKKPQDLVAGGKA